MQVRAFMLMVLGTMAAGASESRPLAGEPWARHVIDGDGRGADGTKLADINGDGWLDIATGWEEQGETRVYLNPGPEGAVRSQWPRMILGGTPAAEDAFFADLDGDGVMDLVTCTEGDSQRVFVHWGPADRSRILDAGAWRQEVFPATARRARWLFGQAAQFDGRHGLDLVLGARPGPQVPPPVIGWLEAPADARDVAGWKWHPLAEAGWIMTIELVDLDGDGDRDLLYSDRMGPTRGIHWFEYPGAAALARGEPMTRHRINQTAVEQVMFLGLGDVDGDGRQDIVGGVELGRVEPGDANRHSRLLWLRREDATGRAWSEQLLTVPANTGNVKGVAVGDIDGDGRADLVVTTEHAHGERRGVYWLRQGATTADRHWEPRDIAGAPGIKFDLVHLIDLDGDGDLDVLTNEESEAGRGLGVIWYENPARRAK